MTNFTYFPTLDTLLPLEKIPPVLGILKESITDAAAHLYYRNLILNRSEWGDEAYYDLTVVSYRRLALDIPNTGGLSLVLFPSQTQPTVSELPITLTYRWKLLAYANRMQSMDLPTTAAQWFDALFFIVNIDPSDFVVSVVEFLFPDSDDPLSAFVNEFTAASLTLTTDPNKDVVHDLLLQFEQLDIDFKAWAIDYLIGMHDQEAERIQAVLDLFEQWTGIRTLDDVVEFFTPMIDLRINELDIALEFPRSWLVPIASNGQPNPDPQITSRVLFDVGGIRFSTRSGLQFLNPANMTFERSEILNTGFIIEGSDIMLDISPTTNIEAAVNDDRPNDFIGIFIGEAAIAFPAAWFQDSDSSTAEIFAANVLIGTGGFSGTLGLRAIGTTGTNPELVVKLGGNQGIHIGFQQFDLRCSKNHFVHSQIEGSIAIPGLEDPAGHPSRLDIRAGINPDGRFHITTSGDIYLGGGLWLFPVNDAPVLSVLIDRNAAETYSFDVRGAFKTPSSDDGSGFQSLEVLGVLTVQKNADGTWRLQSFQAESSIIGTWSLPGSITVTNFRVGLAFDHATATFTAHMGGALSLSGDDDLIDFGARITFNDMQDPTDISFQATVHVQNTLFFDQVGISNGDIVLNLETKPNPTGLLSVRGSGGLIPRDARPPDSWSLSDFYLSLENLDSTMSFSASSLVWSMSSGTLVLPEQFGPHPDTTGTARPDISLTPNHTLTLEYTNNQLSFQGAFDLHNFGVSFGSGSPSSTFMALLSQATVSFNGVNMPTLTDVAGLIRIPIPNNDPMDIVFADVAWNLQGMPVGTLFIDDDVTIDLGGGFTWIIRGASDSSTIQTGLQIEKVNGQTQWTISASMALVIPVSILSGVDGDVVSLAAAGNLRQSTADTIPQIQITELKATGTFHLGGEKGLLVEDGEIRAVQIENLFNPTGSHPFILALSGEVVIPDGPRGGLQNARFTFDENLYPQFDLDGVVVGSGDMALADGYLPLNVKRLEFQFQSGLTLPEKLYPQNITIIMDSEINIQDVLSGSVDDLTITFNSQGIPQTNLNGFHLEVEGLEMGSFVLGGGLYVGGLMDIPDSFVIAGKLQGQLNGTGIMALAAFGVVDGLFMPLGAAIAVELGSAGIPLWATGILLTGASGGISFTGSNADPDDIKSYIQISDDNQVASVPRPDPDDDPDVDPDQQTDVAPAGHAPAGEVLAFSCPDGPCPPPSVGILYEPHPDTDHYPNRIIFKFSSLGKNQVDDILDALGISVTSFEAMTPAAISTQVTTGVVAMFRDSLPFLDDQLDEIELLLRSTLEDALQAAIGDSASLYEALLKEAYKGLRAPNVNMKLTGTFSYTGISAFLSVTGGVVISPTVQSAGIVGTLNLVGIPIGKLRAFLTMNNEMGLPDPALCGDLNVALGPLELGNLRMRIRYGFDIVQFSTALMDAAGVLSSPTLSSGLNVVAPAKFSANGQDPLSTLAVLEPPEQLGLAAFVMQQDLSDEIRDFCLDLFDTLWDSFNPEMLLCGSIQPKIFGLPLGEEVIGVSAQADKLSFAANFRFSPTAILSYCLYGIFPPCDKMEVGFRVALPNPRPLIEAGFGQKASLGQVSDFFEDGMEHMLNQGVASLSYQIAPLGVTLADAQGRLIMPDLLNHPCRPGRHYVRPENQPGNIPSRKDVLIAALDADVLSNVFWAGSSVELRDLPGLAHANAIGNRSLREDYFPYGGFLGAGKVNLPRILVNPPPFDTFQQLASGTLLEKVNAAQVLLTDCFTPQTMGRLSFYLPLPNPPLADLQNGASPLQMIESMKSNGFSLDQFTDPNLYALEEVFLEGYIGSKTEPLMFLGIPIGYASVYLEPPQDDSEGILIVESEIPKQSWLKQFVTSAQLHFTIRQKPAQPILDRFQELAQIFAQSTDKESVVNELLMALTDDMPKVSLQTNLHGFKIPPALKSVLTIDTNVSAHIEAYSPMYAYDSQFSGGSALEALKHFGGIALQISGGLTIGKQFGLDIQDGNAVITVIPQGLNFPKLDALFHAAYVQLPFGLPNLSDVTVAFSSGSHGAHPLIGDSSLKITGTVSHVPLTLTLRQIGSHLEFRGHVAASWSIQMNTGTIKEPVAKLKVCDGIHIHSTVTAKVQLTFSSSSLPTGIIKNATFKWNGRTYKLPTMTLSPTINSPGKLVNLIKSNLKNDPFHLFHHFFKDANAWLRALKSGVISLNITDPVHFARVFKVYGNTIDESAKLMAKRFTDVKDVIRGLYYAFNKNITAVLNSLAGAGFHSSQAIANAVFELFSGDHLVELCSYLFNRWKNSWSNVQRTLASRLHEAGYSAIDIAKVLKNHFDIGPILEGIYYAFGQHLTMTLNAIYQSGFNNSTAVVPAVFNLLGNNSARILVGFLKNHWTNWSNPIGTIANRFHSAGFSISATTDALKYHFGSSQINSITKGLKNAWGSGLTAMKNIVSALKAEWGSGLTAMKNITGALLDAWGTNVSDVKKITRSLKYAWGSSYSDMKNIIRALRSEYGTSLTKLKDITKFLKYAWGSSYSDLKTITKALRAVVGSSESRTKDIAKALRSAWGTSYTDMKNITKAMKYAWGSSQSNMKKITKALKSAWGSSAINNITKALKNAWAGDGNRIGKIINSLLSAFGNSMTQMTKIASALWNAGYSKATVIARMVAKGWSVPFNWP